MFCRCKWLFWGAAFKHEILPRETGKSVPEADDETNDSSRFSVTDFVKIAGRTRGFGSAQFARCLAADPFAIIKIIDAKQANFVYKKALPCRAFLRP